MGRGCDFVSGLVAHVDRDRGELRGCGLVLNGCGSGSAAAEFLRLDDDEVLVEGLQGGVGEAGGAVKDGSAREHHVEPLEERAAGHAVEEGLLVEATGVEVGVPKCGSQGWVLQALVAGDQSGFHGGVEVVLLDPLGDALREREVVEGVAEAGDGAVDFEDLVDGAGVVGAFGTDQADVIGR
jgi:hypothetical protein